MAEKTRTKSRREEYRDMTREALLDAGRNEFARVGYSSAGTESIARSARVTRGAFYHHFDDKLDLFDAVVVRLSEQAARKVRKKVGRQTDLWEQLFSGIDAYFEVCVETEYAKIVIQDSPSVLGAKRYLEIDEAHPTALLLNNICALEAAGQIEVEDPVLLGRIINATICRTALLLQDCNNPQELRQSAMSIIERCVKAFARSG